MELLDLIENKKKEYEQHRVLLDNLETYDENLTISVFRDMEEAILYVRYCLYPEFIEACEKDLLKLPCEKNLKGISFLDENSSPEVKKAYRSLLHSLCEVLVQRDHKQDIVMTGDNTSKISDMYIKCLKQLPEWLQNK